MWLAMAVVVTPEPAGAAFPGHTGRGGYCLALAFRVGARLWRELRDRAAARPGFDLRGFHMRALRLGTMGLGTLRDVLG